MKQGGESLLVFICKPLISIGFSLLFAKRVPERYGRVMINRLFPTLFKGKSPYEAIDPASVPDDCKGWGSEDPFLEEIIRTVRPSTVLEIGSWKGGSAIHMARCARREGIATEIICADPHVGSPGLWLANPEAMYTTPTGECGTYTIMLANIKRAELTDLITPFRATSSVVTSVMRQQGLCADLIYIDGSHDAIDVEADLRHALKVVHPDTVIVCDDYDHPRLTGVTEAVGQFLRLNSRFNMAAAKETGLHLYTERIVGTETAKKCVLVQSDSQFACRF